MQDQVNAKLIGEIVIEEILNKHGFINFKTIFHRRNSKCIYRENKTTILKLNYEAAIIEDVESIIVAAHEASHALNYREGVVNPRKMKVAEILYYFFTVLSFSYCIISPWLFQGLIWTFLLVCLQISSIFVYTFHFKNYINDEIKTESRALKEIKNVFENLQTDISIEEIEKRNKYRMNNYILGQKLWIQIVVYLIATTALYFVIQLFTKFY